MPKKKKIIDHKDDHKLMRRFKSDKDIHSYKYMKKQAKAEHAQNERKIRRM